MYNNNNPHKGTNIQNSSIKYRVTFNMAPEEEGKMRKII